MRKKKNGTGEHRTPETQKKLLKADCEEKQKNHLHKTDDKEQLRDTLQVETAGALLRDVPCLSGT